MEKWAICMLSVAILNDSLAFWLSLLERTLNHVLPAWFPHEVGERTRPRKITSPKKSGPGLDWFDLHYCKYVCIKNCWTFPKCTLFLCFSTRQKKKKEKKKKKKNGSGRTPATLASRVTANIVSEDCEEIPFLVPDVGVAVLVCLTRVPIKGFITEQSSSFSVLFFIWTEKHCNGESCLHTDLRVIWFWDFDFGMTVLKNYFLSDDFEWYCSHGKWFELTQEYQLFV